MTFLVTTPIPAPGMDILAAAGPVEVLPAPPSSEDLARLCATGDYDVVVAQLRDDLGAAVLERAALRGVSVYAVGVNNVDLDAATRRGIVVANTPDVLTDATADVAMLLMLAAARRAVDADRFLREGRYHGWEPELLRGRDISGSTLGLAGFGRIARATARRALGFGMRVRRRAGRGHDLGGGAVLRPRRPGQRHRDRRRQRAAGRLPHALVRDLLS
jgi:glyoxylate reductase